MSILDKIKKNSSIKESAILSKSKFFTDKDMIPTAVPAINIALSGKLDGGLTPGLTMWAGPSKHFKTAFSLLMAKSYLDKYPDAALLFYDSEFGTPQSYFDSFGIDTDRVLHTPLTDIEQLKFDVMQQLTQLERGDHLIIVIDSIGNLGSKKEVDDALDGKSVADMSRAKQVKSLFRMITPHLSLKDIPMIVVNHTYKEIGMFPKDIVGGGTGSYYSADNIFIIGRQQEKEGTEVVGYHFVINVEKSRYVREKSKIPVTVLHDGGISKWSGLLDIALESKHVVKPKAGWYQRVDEDGVIEEKNYREKDTNSSAFWLPILKQKSFQQFVESKYRVAHGEILASDVEETFDVRPQMELLEGTDYCFIYPKDDGSAVHIKLLTGPYKDTVFKYGKVKFEERHGNVYLLFAYYVLESPVMKPKKLESDKDFKDYIGPLLVELMSGNLEQDIIDETGTDDSQESDLQ